MENVSYVALSSQVALRRALDVTANNVANMNTVGFKADRVLFDQAMSRVSTRAGGEGDPVTQVVDRSTFSDLRQGGILVTGNPLDIAIQGAGWLQVETPEGVRYTRDGRLLLDAMGQLVIADGSPVLDEGGAPILIPQDEGELSFSEDGAVLIDGEEIARIGLVSFDEPHALVKEGGLLYAAPLGALPVPAIGSRIIPGAVEQSNVQPIVEMTRLIEVQRAYEAAQRAVESAHELQRGATARLGRVA